MGQTTYAEQDRPEGVGPTIPVDNGQGSRRGWLRREVDRSRDAVERPTVSASEVAGA